MSSCSSHGKPSSTVSGVSSGQNIGAGTRAVVQWQLKNRPHPEQGYRACLGLLNLSGTYGEERLEAACRRALAIGSPTRKRTIAILKARLDQHPELLPAAATASRTHSNVRGADYFRDPPTPTDNHRRRSVPCHCGPRTGQAVVIRVS